jgi:hypothetical protein
MMRVSPTPYTLQFTMRTYCASHTDSSKAKERYEAPLVDEAADFT